MKPFRSLKTKEIKLNSRPPMYGSMSNNPQKNRLDRGIDVRENSLKVASIKTVSGRTSLLGGTTYGATLTVDHNLKTIPFIIARLTLDGALFPIPYADLTFDTYATYESLDKKSVTISIITVGEVDIEAKLYFLREQLI